MGLMDGRIAVVTGGGGGIGAATVERLAREGAKVVAADIADERLTALLDRLRSADLEVHGEVVDVCRADGVDHLRDAVLEHYGHVDVLVNNVGDFLGGRGPFVDSTDEQWGALHDVNLGSAMRCTRAFLRPMLERGEGGSIVNVSSVEGFRAIPGLTVYGTYKGAIAAFTRSLAVELGPEGIRVNAVAPDKVDSIQTAYTARWSPEELASVGQWIPLGRLGTPEDVAGAVLFLASELSAFVTGTTVHADGGTYAAGGWYLTPGGRWTNTPHMVADT